MTVKVCGTKCKHEDLGMWLHRNRFSVALAMSTYWPRIDLVMEFIIFSPHAGSGNSPSSKPLWKFWTAACRDNLERCSVSIRVHRDAADPLWIYSITFSSKETSSLSKKSNSTAPLMQTLYPKRPPCQALCFQINPLPCITPDMHRHHSSLFVFS